MAFHFDFDPEVKVKTNLKSEEFDFERVPSFEYVKLTKFQIDR